MAVNEVNINQGVAKAAARDARRDANTFFDFGKATRDIAQSSTVMLNAHNTSEAATARTDYYNIIKSPEYANQASDTVRADVLDKAIQGLEGKSKSYVDAFTSVSSSEYMARNDGRNHETNLSQYSVIGSTEDAWNESDSGVEYQAQQADGTIVTKTYSNRAAGKGPQDFSKWMQLNNPSMKMSDIRDAQLNSLQMEKVEALSTATSRDDLARLKLDFAEMDAPYNEGNMYLKSGSAELSRRNKANQTLIASTFKALDTKFTKEAKSNIAMKNNSNDPDPFLQYQYMPEIEEYKNAYGEDAPQKYRDDMSNFNVAEKDRADVLNHPIYESNDLSGYSTNAQKAIQVQLTENIQMDLMNGDINSASEAIILHGSKDPKRMKEVSSTLMSSMYDKDTAGVTLSTLHNMSLTNNSAFNLLITDPEQRAKLLATKAFATAKNWEPQQAWEYMNDPLTGGMTKLNSGQHTKVNNVIQDKNIPPMLRKDLAAMSSALKAKGMPYDVILNTLTSYHKSSDHEIDFTKEYGQEVSNILDYSLSKVYPEGTTVYQNKATNTIEYYDDLGMNLSYMDKDKFVQDSTSIAYIKRYNRDHPISTKMAKGLDRLTSLLSAQLQESTSPNRLQGSQFSRGDGEAVKPSGDAFLDFFNQLNSPQRLKGRQ